MSIVVTVLLDNTLVTYDILVPRVTFLVGTVTQYDGVNLSITRERDRGKFKGSWYSFSLYWKGHELDRKLNITGEM